jgi:hypothetical protein
MDSQDTPEYQAKLDQLVILDRQVKDKLDLQDTLVTVAILDIVDLLVTVDTRDIQVIQV